MGHDELIGCLSDHDEISARFLFARHTLRQSRLDGAEDERKALRIPIFRATPENKDFEPEREIQGHSLILHDAAGRRRALEHDFSDVRLSSWRNRSGSSSYFRHRYCLLFLGSIAPISLGHEDARYIARKERRSPQRKRKTYAQSRQLLGILQDSNATQQLPISNCLCP